MSREIIIFDTEFTTWEGCIVHGWRDWQKKEIVQIAAIKVDMDTFNVLDELNVYIKPKFNPIVSDYFINLTGITNELINEKGVSFESAYSQFITFVGNLECYSHGWSLSTDNIADGAVMNLNLEYLGVKDNNPPKYNNIANWFMRIYKENNINIEKQNSGQIAKLLGVSDELREIGLDEHNAIYDVYSILAGIKYFKPKSFD